MVWKKSGWSILLSKDLKPPALLAVCRQIRNEALEFFYLSNKIHVRIKDYDASLLYAWRTHLNTLSSNIGSRVIFIRVLGRPCWKNLDKWCEHVWSGLREIKTSKKQHTSKPAQIVNAAHRIGLASRGNSWAICEDQLNALRIVLGQLDRR